MGPIAEALSNEDIRNLGAYYASLPPPKRDAATGSDALALPGEKLAARHRCRSCHGEDYSGVGPAARCRASAKTSCCKLCAISNPARASAPAWPRWPMRRSSLTTPTCRRSRTIWPRALDAAPRVGAVPRQYVAVSRALAVLRGRRRLCGKFVRLRVSPSSAAAADDSEYVGSFAGVSVSLADSEHGGWCRSGSPVSPNRGIRRVEIFNRQPALAIPARQN